MIAGDHSYAVRVVRNVSAYMQDHRNSEVIRVKANNAQHAQLAARVVTGAAVALEPVRVSS